MLHILGEKATTGERTGAATEGGGDVVDAAQQGGSAVPAVGAARGSVSSGAGEAALLYQDTGWQR